VRAEMNNPRPILEQKNVDRYIATIHEHLDEDAFNTAYSVGHSMTMAEAIKLASEV